MFGVIMYCFFCLGGGGGDLFNEWSTPPPPPPQKNINSCIFTTPVDDIYRIIYLLLWYLNQGTPLNPKVCKWLKTMAGCGCIMALSDLMIFRMCTFSTLLRLVSSPGFCYILSFWVYCSYPWLGRGSGGLSALVLGTIRLQLAFQLQEWIWKWRVLSQNDLSAIFEIFEERAQSYNTK